MPKGAFATAIGENDDDDSLADRTIEDVDRIIDEELSELPTIPPPTAMVVVMLPAVEYLPLSLVPMVMTTWLGQRVAISFRVLEGTIE